MLMQHYAHTIEGHPPEAWELLEDHLQLVAKYCQQFASSFQAGELGHILGLWHDIGKYSREFQDYLRRENGADAHLENVTEIRRVDHSTAGAQLADRQYRTHPFGRMLAYCIAGHHSGLADAFGESGTAGLEHRLKKQIFPFSDAPSHLLEKPALPQNMPISLGGKGTQLGFQLALFTRMLFSCLVDADYLATEAFVSPDTAEIRTVELQSMNSLQARLDTYLQKLSAGKAGVVAETRAEVLRACRDAATRSRGLYSLTVPTGGGKTLSSLAFGVSHAHTHRMDRVIYAIPFTSIIEQTAEIFRRVFEGTPEGTILEHHCNTDPDRESAATRLITQNWNAPIIVTTNVQLFESLFAARTSRCRKLHNICNSVIILDEVQAIPVDLLQPVLATIQELVRNYGCTVMLCTATQPAFQRCDQFPIGLAGVSEIMPDVPRLFQRLKRVRIQFTGSQTDQQITAELLKHDQFLCIVNTRAHAAKLFSMLATSATAQSENPSEAHPQNTDSAQFPARDSASAAGLFHLSTLMCGSHRQNVLEQIRERLNARQTCRVISTQLIEAGVDVDFPVVFRAVTGIDSIAQAAGRCNREGRFTAGNVVVFNPESVKLQGYLRATADSALELIADLPQDDLDLLNHDTVRRYFNLHFWRHKHRWDAKNIMNCFPAPNSGALPPLDFLSASQRFSWIEDNAKTVFVPYNDEARSLIDHLRQIRFCPANTPLLRKLILRLQRYSVSLFAPIYNAMCGTDIELLESGYAVLINETCYHADMGICADRSGYHEPESLVI
jgi:CRISPR-associated endonuclease/helicase Cas3